MELLMIALMLLALDLVALRRGADSRLIREQQSRPAI